MTQHTIHIIGGPTASGKSALGLEIATTHNGIIINADSMQIYDGLGILTAQPSEQDKQTVPHALYGCLHPNQDSSAGNWREMVEPIIEQALENGQTPIIVGGSGLYIKSLMEGFSPIPDIPEDVRQAAIDAQEELGNPKFYEELEKKDPVMAGRLHPYHTARLIRAWEVLEATGKSLAEWQELPRIQPHEDWVFDVKLVMPEREILNKRCNDRFVQMLEMGALEELKEFNALKDKGEIKDNTLLNRALGARPLSAYMNGALTREEAVEKAQIETRQYAKRQLTWFRHQVKEEKNVAKIEILS